MRLKELRMQHKLLQKDVAEILRCSVPVYCRYEKGDREPPLGILLKLAEYYGVTVDYLMGADTQEPQPEQPEVNVMFRSDVPDLYHKLNDENRALVADFARALFAAQAERKERENKNKP